MKDKLLMTGAIGTLVSCTFCFTPVLVWLFNFIGLASLVVYLDLVLLPLVGLFAVILLLALVFKFID